MSVNHFKCLLLLVSEKKKKKGKVRKYNSRIKKQN